MSIKITSDNLSQICPFSKHEYFGEWYNDIPKLHTSFVHAKPFPHVVIENFLQNDIAHAMSDSFPSVSDHSWYSYCSPIEVKRAMDNLDQMPEIITKFFHILSCQDTIDTFCQISGIHDLEYDPYIHGAGLHAHPQYGRLNIHLDYEKHPYLHDKERRLNLILFMTKDWKDEWGGHNELWDSPEGNLRVKTPVKFNTAILFQTNHSSWHGIPEIIQCPPNHWRRTIAYYYISPLTSPAGPGTKIGDNGTGYREKAAFIRQPNQRDTPQLRELLSIRPLRRITSEDIHRLYPHWIVNHEQI